MSDMPRDGTARQLDDVLAHLVPWVFTVVSCGKEEFERNKDVTVGPVVVCLLATDGD